MALLIREAFLRGISTRQVDRVVATLTGEAVSAQTVSKLTRDLDEVVRRFHQAPLKDEWAYLFLDGVSLRVRRPGGRKREPHAGGLRVCADRTRQLLAFLRSQGESQQAWEIWERKQELAARTKQQEQLAAEIANLKGSTVALAAQ